MRRLTTILVLGATLLSISTAKARTPAATCRRECAPRIVEQCAALAGADFRRCRRPLVKACKRATPAAACATTTDLTRELEGHRVQLDGIDLTLCTSGTFQSVESIAEEGTNVASGTWAVRLADGALLLGLESEQADTRDFRLERDASGALVVGGRAAIVGDAGAACDVSDEESVDASQALVAIARALADRTFDFIVALDLSGGGTTKRQLTLCSAGSFTLTVETTVPPETRTSTGTWTLRPLDGRIVLELADEDGSQQQINATLDAAGDVHLEEQTGTADDARGLCAGGGAPEPPAPPTPAEIVAQFTAALANRAYFLTEETDIAPLRTKIGFCETGRHAIIQTSTRRGPWIVKIVDGVPVVELDSDPGIGGLIRVFESFALSFDATGDVLLDGQHAPIDEPSIVDAACS